MSEDRLKQLESQVAAMQEALYANGIMQRPKPPAPVYPTSDATRLEIRPNLGLRGAIIQFEYQCACGEFHRHQLTGVTVHPGTIGERNIECANKAITRVRFHFPEDEAILAVREAVKDTHEN